MTQTKNGPRAADLAHAISREVLHNLAGVRSFERGENYFESGCVGRLAEYQNRVTASVQGTQKYVLKLYVENGGLRHDCTCPVGRDGSFCKHCVAVGLAWLEQHEKASGSRGTHRDPPPTMDDVRAYLVELSKETLVDILMDQSLEDERLRERLLMRAATHRAKSSGGRLDVRSFINAIDNAIEEQDDVSYCEAAGYARGIDDAVDAIENLLKDGHGTEAVEVIEHAFHAVEEAIERVDDSDGHLGSILERLAELHFAACTKAKLDPEVLAERLLDLELRAEYGEFRGAVERYAGLLGKKGLTKYRALAEAVWSQVPTRGSGQDTLGHAHRYGITAIMETLARMSGDLDEWIAVKSRDLSQAYHFLDIAEACKKARKYDLALEWAERGIKVFPNRPDSRLREFLAEEYHRRKRHDDAMTLIWAEFAESPELRTYQLLANHAQRLKDWPAWRTRALKYMKEHIAKEKQAKPKARFAWQREMDHSVLVEVFLWEKDIDAAWKEAQEGGCSTELWLKLAKERAKEHPEDAVPIYQKQIEPTLAQKNNAAYAQALEYLRIIRDLMNSVDRKTEFAAYLALIRTAHKPKRNFMKLLGRFK